MAVNDDDSSPPGARPKRRPVQLFLSDEEGEGEETETIIGMSPAPETITITPPPPESAEEPEDTPAVKKRRELSAKVCGF